MGNLIHLKHNTPMDHGAKYKDILLKKPRFPGVFDIREGDYN